MARVQTRITWRVFNIFEYLGGGGVICVEPLGLLVLMAWLHRDSHTLDLSHFSMPASVPVRSLPSSQALSFSHLLAYKGCSVVLIGSETESVRMEMLGLIPLAGGRSPTHLECRVGCHA